MIVVETQCCIVAIALIQISSGGAFDIVEAIYRNAVRHESNEQRVQAGRGGTRTKCIGRTLLRGAQPSIFACAGEFIAYGAFYCLPTTNLFVVVTRAVRDAVHWLDAWHCVVVIGTTACWVRTAVTQ
jgi:hypothetical protein